MKQELDEALCAKYPKIFADRHGSMRETAMCWGFDVGDGWYDIIDKLCAEIQAIADKDGLEVRAAQVKEKFGGLRFYVDGGNDKIRAAISRAEAASGETCETCGKPGKIVGISWMYCACPDHVRKDV